MTAPSAADRPLNTEELERDLMARLGLPPASSSEDVDAAHRAVTAYLAHAPRELKDWARNQAAAADEAYGLLIDPAALADSVALVGPTARPAAMPGGPATPPARRGPSATKSASDGAGSVAEVSAHGTAPVTVAHEPTFEELLAEVTPSTHRDSAPKPNVLSSGAAQEVPPPGRGISSGAKRLAVGGAVIVAAIAIAVGGYQLGNADGTTSSPSPSSAAAASAAPTLDTAAVAALMQKIQANPKDTESLMALADEYYKVDDFTTAATWLEKLLAVDANNVRALLALGAAQFNLGKMDEAKVSWDKVVAVEPDNIEAHYDLGFYYLNQTPPDMTGVQAEWNKVIEISPDSDVAKTVKSHLDALVSPAPSSGASPAPSGAASPAASPAPSGSAAPSASPAPSAAPSASPAASGSSQP